MTHAEFRELWTLMGGGIDLTPFTEVLVSEYGRHGTLLVCRSAYDDAVARFSVDDPFALQPHGFGFSTWLSTIEGIAAYALGNPCSFGRGIPDDHDRFFREYWEPAYWENRGLSPEEALAATALTGAHQGDK